MNKDRRYVSIHRELLQNTSLSLEAKGLYVSLLSLPFYWEGSMVTLAESLGTEECRIKAILCELEKNGYLECRQTKDNTGRIYGLEYETKVRGEDTWESQIITLTRN